MICPPPRSIRHPIPTLVAIASTLLLAASAQAVPVYGTSAQGELSGSRSVAGGGLVGYGAWATAFTISWDITQNGNTWSYAYTFTGLSGSGQEKDVSHTVFDLSDDCTGSDCVFNVDPIEGDIEFGDKDGIVGGVKFDWGGSEGVTYTFDSNRAPVYGHLAVKGGGGPQTCATAMPTGEVVCNAGFYDASSMDAIDFIARPNGVVPEPTVAAMLGLALLGLGASARRR